VIKGRKPAGQRRREGTPTLKVVVDEAAREDLAAGLGEIVREGARRVLAAALEDEVAACIAAHVAGRDEDGRRLVVRNGHARPRQVTTAAGAIEARAPRVNGKRTGPATGARMRFCSAILPPWCRKSPKITEVLPLLYLHGLTSKDFMPALEQFPGSGAGLPASAITRLTGAWQQEHRRWCDRDLPGAAYVSCWAGGLHFGVRLNQDRVCTLVVIGVHAGGKKELAALTGGHRESTGSWAGLLRDARRRGMRAPVLAAGDGALGFWAALREVSPQTRQGRCWVHKVASVLDRLPKSARPAARKALAQIRDAEDREHAEKAVKDFAAAYGAKYPKAVATITGDQPQLRAFSGAPAGHRVHLKTSSPIGIYVRHHAAADQGHQGAGEPAGRAGDGLQARPGRRGPVALRPPPHLVALVRASAKPGKGTLAERPDEAEMKDAA
jgi:putative transposase